jgi:hypothetical protein
LIVVDGVAVSGRSFFGDWQSPDQRQQETSVDRVR